LEFIPKKQYLLLWNQSICCTFDSLDHYKGLKKTHDIGLVTLQSSQHCTV